MDRGFPSSRVFHMVPCAMQAAASEVGPTSTRSLVVCCFFLVVVCCCLLVLCVRVWLLLVVERPPQKSVLFFCFVLRCFFYGTVQKIQRTTKALRPCRRYEAANRKLSVFLCGIALAAGGAQNFPGRCVNQRCSPGPTSLKTPRGASTNEHGASPGHQHRAGQHLCQVCWTRRNLPHCFGRWAKSWSFAKAKKSVAPNFPQEVQADPNSAHW